MSPFKNIENNLFGFVVSYFIHVGILSLVKSNTDMKTASKFRKQVIENIWLSAFIIVLLETFVVLPIIFMLFGAVILKYFQINPKEIAKQGWFVEINAPFF